MQAARSGPKRAYANLPEAIGLFRFFSRFDIIHLKSTKLVFSLDRSASSMDFIHTAVLTLLIFMPGDQEVQMNSIVAIHPYKHHGMWVFDDPAVGLRQEPLVSGADAIIDKLAGDIPDAEKGFTLLFSGRPFPGHQAVFEWRRAESGGNWYFSPALHMEGWLCPALSKDFDSAPPKIYAQFRPKAA